MTVHRVVDKLLHTPTVRVKELAGAPAGASYAEALRELFDLDLSAVAAVSAAPARAGHRRCPMMHRSADPSARHPPQRAGHRPVRHGRATHRGGRRGGRPPVTGRAGRGDDAGDVSGASLASFGGIGVFVSPLREALLAGEVDLAVHSLKDLPTAPAPGLLLAAVPPREDPRDVLVARDGLTLAELPAGARIGTGSPRRAAQLRALRPRAWTVVDVRGNVDTRLRLRRRRPARRRRAGPRRTAAPRPGRRGHRGAGPAR